MADFPIELGAALAGRLARALDVEAKIPRALETLGPVAGRDVYLVDGQSGGIRATQLDELGARVVVGGPIGGTPPDVADASMDVVVGCWTPFRGVVASEMTEVARILRPGGRLLAIHDYGRDDVSRLHGPRPEYTEWSHRDGPFLRSGFKIRVIHCFWTFESVEAGQGFLADAFRGPGKALGATMTRPRLSYNVAVYHRSFDGRAWSAA